MRLLTVFMRKKANWNRMKFFLVQIFYAKKLLENKRRKKSRMFVDSKIQPWYANKGAL